MKYTRSLSSYGELAEVGGKAYALMKLMRANYNVVDGFVITTEAYKDWLENKRLPKALMTEVKEKLNFLRYSLQYPLIVRSSATVEDSGKTSFAGIFTSCPNVNSVNDLAKSIKTIYKDATSNRVLKYCELKGIDPKSIGMSVLVQKQLDPEHSGIVFTKNPVNCKDEVILEYVEGVPWGLVSGREHANRAVLTDKSEKFNELYQVSKEIEEFLGAPQDIEWAFDGKKYWILQSRPITTLVNREAKAEKPVVQAKNSVTVTGTTASLGHVKGKIQYIYDNVPVKEAESVFKKGNILATILLFPEYDCVMANASGIIAYNDSINSHVAIIARELGIPCLVGVDLKNLSRYAADFDEIVLDADHGKIIVQKPRVSLIRDKSKIQLGEMPAWTKKVDRQGKQLINNLTKAVKEENVKELENGINKTIVYILDNARSAPEASRPLFHRLCEFLQDDFVDLLLKKYPQKYVLGRLSRMDSDSKAKPEETIDEIYLLTKKHIKALDLLEVDGKKIFELERS